MYTPALAVQLKLRRIVIHGLQTKLRRDTAPLPADLVAAPHHHIDNHPRIRELAGVEVFSTCQAIHDNVSPPAHAVTGMSASQRRNDRVHLGCQVALRHLPSSVGLTQCCRAVAHKDEP